MSRSAVTTEKYPSISKDSSKLWPKIVICSLLLLGVGAINGLWARSDYQEWYASLNKPFFSPPPARYVGMIWVLMYLSMAVAVSRIWQIATNSPQANKQEQAWKGIRLFVLQIVVNMIVPILFFRLNNLPLLLTGVTVNFLVNLFVLRSFLKIDPMAGKILIPYTIWLLYAIILDAGLLILN